MFKMPHEKTLTGRIGKLIPVYFQETLPNDTFKVTTEVIVKLAPLIAPIYHRLTLYIHYFFVPMRLIMEEYEAFFTGGRLGPGVDVPPSVPYYDVGTLLAANQDFFETSTLADYLGFPAPVPDSGTALWAGRRMDARPFGAYYKVWYDYYRDRNYFGDEDLLPMGGGLQGSSEFMNLRTRAWQPDYFTTALPWTQRGSEILMPLEGSGSVTYLEQSIVNNLNSPSGDDNFNLGRIAPLPPDTPNLVVDGGFLPDGAQLKNIDEVNLDASSVSINDFRMAQALQMYLERNALAGSRYNEFVWAHFNRRTSDGRLQRAEYLGGGKAVIKISEINTTSYSEDAEEVNVPPGNPVGRGSVYANTNSFTYNCEEHGFVTGVLSVMPTGRYMQGAPRYLFGRWSVYDYPVPLLANLGEQQVYDYEIYATPTSIPAGASPEFPGFGYQSRYSDWKDMQSTTHGDFRTSLEFWHLTRKFSSQPDLGGQFVTFEDELQDRIFNVSGVDTLWLYIYNDVRVVRSLPYFGVPAGLAVR